MHAHHAQNQADSVIAAQFKYNVADQTFQNRGHVHPNEDRVLTCPDVGGTGIVLACAIDGHGGHTTAQLTKDRFVDTLIATEGWQAEPRDLEAAITQTFAVLDEAGRDAGKDGACCVCALIDGAKLLVGWVGDSAAALLEDGKCVCLTRDHHPDDPAEQARMEAAGCENARGPDGKMRSYGILAVSRALGDAVQRGPGSAVIAVPEFAHHKLTVKAEMLVLGSDGVFETLGAEKVIALAHKNRSMSAKGIARKIARTATMDKNNYDDTTAVVVRLHGDEGAMPGLCQAAEALETHMQMWRTAEQIAFSFQLPHLEGGESINHHALSPASRLQDAALIAKQRAAIEAQEAIEAAEADLIAAQHQALGRGRRRANSTFVSSMEAATISEPPTLLGHDGAPIRHDAMPALVEQDATREPEPEPGPELEPESEPERESEHEPEEQGDDDHWAPTPSDLGFHPPPHVGHVHVIMGDSDVLVGPAAPIPTPDSE